MKPVNVYWKIHKGNCPTLEKMEMNNNGNKEKCAVNDDTTSYNSMIPSFCQHLQKKAEK